MSRKDMHPLIANPAESSGLISTVNAIPKQESPWMPAPIPRVTNDVSTKLLVRRLRGGTGVALHDWRSLPDVFMAQASVRLTAWMNESPLSSRFSRPR